MIRAGRTLQQLFLPVVCFGFMLGSVVLLAAQAGSDFVNAAPQPGEPTDLKARKAYASAVDWERHRMKDAAIDDYRKANKLDGGHCGQCITRAYRLAQQQGAYKQAIDIVREGLPGVTNDKDRAMLHFMLGNALLDEVIQSKKPAVLNESRDELQKALQLDPTLSQAHYKLGMVLGRLNDDDGARAQFRIFLDEDRKLSTLHPRVQRYLERVDLTRAKMAPPFYITTLDGQRISLDGLAGKVVLLDFWATWCGPCREALPHIRSIAEKYKDQPLVVLSISLDTDENKWRDFVAKNKMTWTQAHDNGFGGQVAKLFGVNAIPATFSIDADGVLEDQHAGDASIEGKLKKMVAQAVEAEKHRKIVPASAN